MRIEDIDNLVETHGSALYGFCCRLTNNTADADDLYQDVFLKATKVIHRIDETSNPRSYLFSIALGVWKSGRRKYARRLHIAPVVSMDYIAEQSENVNIENDYLNKELCDLLNKEINYLSEKLKLPLYLFYSIGMSVDEAATVIGVPSGTVKSRLHKARKILRKRLEDAGYE